MLDPSPKNVNSTFKNLIRHLVITIDSDREMGKRNALSNYFSSMSFNKASGDTHTGPHAQARTHAHTHRRTQRPISQHRCEEQQETGCR